MSRKSKALEFVDEGYSVNVFGRNITVTDAMRDYALEKIAKMERFGARIIEVNMTMEVQRFDHKVDMVMKVNDIKIKCTATEENMYAAIDKAVDKLQKQLVRYKTRIQNHHARHVNVEDMIVKVLKPREDEDLKDINLDIEYENQRSLHQQFVPHEIVSQETRQLKTLTLDEAVMKMELSGDAFLIFRCESTRKVCVMYRRKDNHFGVIEAES